MFDDMITVSLSVELYCEMTWLLPSKRPSHCWLPYKTLRLTVPRREVIPAFTMLDLRIEESQALLPSGNRFFCKKICHMLPIWLTLFSIWLASNPGSMMIAATVTVAAALRASSCPPPSMPMCFRQSLATILLLAAQYSKLIVYYIRLYVYPSDMIRSIVY